MTCSNAAASPAIRELRAEIDMPERTQSEVDITFTGSKSVTFRLSLRVFRLLEYHWQTWQMVRDMLLRTKLERVLI